MTNVWIIFVQNLMKFAKNLPDATTSMDQYIPTEGAALALAARVRLQAC